MSSGALSAALIADTEHVACFGPGGAEYRWPELVAAASGIAAQMRAAGGRRWALNLDDTFEFAAALLGCWAAGSTAVLAPRPMLESDDAGVSIDGVIEASEAVHAAPAKRRRIVWTHPADTGERITDIPLESELVLYTSGSTGRPKEISRTVRNVEAELAVLESLWGDTIGASKVYSTVSHRHVYGLLFRVLWPLLARRPLATFDLEYPEQLTDGRGEGQVLITSPALLKRIGHLGPAPTPWRAVFSSGGLLPANAAADSMRLLGACPVEVLGSTETSGVATRRQLDSEATSFAAMPRVEIRAGDEDYLEVRSPFSGEADWLRMGDRVRLRGEGKFELLGRADHIAKIEDKRVSLAEIERHLIKTEWVEDAAAVALEDTSRQYVGVLLELTDIGAAELRSLGRAAFNDLLKQCLRPVIEPVALPRKFRYVDEIPVDAQGKRRPGDIRARFLS